MDPAWFEGEGWPAVAAAALLFVLAGGVLLWLRGPGSRPHDPPIARDSVRAFALILIGFGVLWLGRAVAGIGGDIVLGALLLVVTLGFMARGRLRQSERMAAGARDDAGGSD